MHCFLPEGFYHDACFVRLIIGGGDPGGTAMRFMIHGSCSCHYDSERYILLVLGTIPTRFGIVWYHTIHNLLPTSEPVVAVSKGSTPLEGSEDK